MLKRKNELSLRLDKNNPMNSNRNLHKLLRFIFTEVLMENFEITGWHYGSVKIEVRLDKKRGSPKTLRVCYTNTLSCQKKVQMLEDNNKSETISHGFDDYHVIQNYPDDGQSAPISE